MGCTCFYPELQPRRRRTAPNGQATMVGQPLSCIQVAPHGGWRTYGDDMLALPLSPLDFTLTSFEESVPGCELTPDQDYGSFHFSNPNTATFSTPCAGPENGEKIDISRLDTPKSLASFNLTIDGTQEPPEARPASNGSEDSVESDTFSAGLVNIDDVSKFHRCSGTTEIVPVCSTRIPCTLTFRHNRF